MLARAALAVMCVGYCVAWPAAAVLVQAGAALAAARILTAADTAACLRLPACSAESEPWKDPAVLAQLHAQRLQLLAESGRQEGMTFPPLPAGASAAAADAEAS